MQIYRFGAILLSLALSLSACTYTMKVKDGATAYDRKQYAVAVDFLQKEYRKSKSRVERGKIAYMLADSYRQMNQDDQSIEWFEIAYTNGYGIEALEQYAYSLKKAERYKEARQAFVDLGFEIGSPYEYRREVNACEVAQTWKEDEKYAGYQVREADFNSNGSDYAPVLFGDQSILFTSDRSSGKDDETYLWTGRSFSDIFEYSPEDLTIEPVDLPINTENNEGTIAFNKDFSELFFTRCFSEDKWEDAYCQIYVSEKQPDGNWSEPVPLSFQETEVNYGHPALSADENRLYFSANHPEGWGGYDIWYTERVPEGWSDPQLMNRSINTMGDEKFPSVDGDTLYFASNNHTGMGGLDIFKSYTLNNGSWSPAYNLLPPINSGADDFGLVIDRRKSSKEGVLQTGYFSSSRGSGTGVDDIFRFEKVVPPPRPEPEEPVVVEYKMLLKGFVLEKIYDNPDDPNSRVLGRKALPGAKVDIEFGEIQKKVEVGEDGLFELTLEEDMDYVFTASKKDYLTSASRFSTKGIGKDPNQPVQEFEVEIVLDRIYTDKEIVLENIYYDFDRWEIRDDAKPTLDELVDILELNPDRRIQMGSHTDCRGNPRYNLDLSQRRAQSAVDYLISKGISSERLIARGYGENSPANDCVCSRCSEDEHQENRRTTFLFLE